MAVATAEIPFFGSSFEGKSFSLAHAENKKGKSIFSEMTKMLVIATVASALGCAVPAGYHLGVLNAPQVILQEFCNNTLSAKYDIHLTANQLDLFWAFVVSVMVIGGMIGSGAAGWVCNIMGRRRALLFNQLFGIAAAALFVASKTAGSVEMLMLGRLLVGFYCGFTFSAVPVYLTEISPLSLRGALGCVQQLGLNVGILIAQILGLKNIMGTEDAWHYLLAIFAIPIVIFSVVLYFCPESPKYLFIVKEQQAAALSELSRLRGVPSTQLQNDVMELREEMKLHLAEPKWSLWRLLSSRELRLPLLLVCAFQGGQQLSGINVVFYYSTSVFINAGISEENSQYASIGACVINSVMGTLAMVTVSKFTRRRLTIVSLSSVVVCLLIFTLALELKNEVQWMSYVAVVSLLSYVLVYGVGLGPIPFFIGAELFQQGPKPAAMSLGCWASWTCNFIIGMSFPPLQTFIGAYCFLIFAAITILLLIYIHRNLPETKDKDPVEVAKYFAKQYKLSRGETVEMEGEAMIHQVHQKQSDITPANV